MLTVACSGNRLTGKQLEVYVDNVGSVVMFRKGWSTVCNLCNTILVALHQLSTALACKLFITDIARCSNRESRAADTLRKCDMDRFLENMPEANIEPEEIPASILNWIENPVPDRDFGNKIIQELSSRYNLVTYR